MPSGLKTTHGIARNRIRRARFALQTLDSDRQILLENAHGLIRRTIQQLDLALPR
jgi:hypothetical protein